MCVAFFIATDYVTSPNTKAGQLVFGAGCGLLTFVIRTWGAYPEGAGICHIADERGNAADRSLHTSPDLRP